MLNATRSHDTEQRSNQLNSRGRQWILIQKTGKSALWLDEEVVTSIGSEGCDILVQSPTVNREHAVLWFDPDSSYFYLKDLDTGSGTFINGKKMNSSISSKLRNMDLIRFGFAHPHAHSNLYQIRCESTDCRGTTVHGETTVSDPKAQQLHKMESNGENGETFTPPSNAMRQNDSGNCSSSSPCSPVKSGQFPSSSTSSVCLSAATLSDTPPVQQNQHGVSEELFSNKYSPMAFTVDFGPTETKNFDLSASISKFAPNRHKRNSKAEREKRAGSEGGESSNSRRNQTPSTNSESDYGKGKPKTEPVTLKSTFGNLSGTNQKAQPKVEDDRKSETGTYTVELEEAKKDREESIFEREEDTESPLDSSLEWVREWAERASTQIEQNPTPPPTPYRNFARESDRLLSPPGADSEESLNFRLNQNSSELQKKLNRNSWHEGYSENYDERVQELSIRPPQKMSPGNSRRHGREASAVSDYSAYGRSRPGQSHTQLTYTASFNATRSNIPTHQREKSRERQDYCENLSSPTSRTPNSGFGTAGTNSPNSNFSASSFSRHDGGRFSLRAPNRSNANAPPQQVPQPPPKIWAPTPRLAQPRSVAKIAPNAKPQQQAPPPSPKKLPEKTVLSRKPLLGAGKRANSTLTAKEVELANWNRRKSYDPRKAAALGKNKEKRGVSVEAEICPSDEPGQRNNPDGAASITKSPSFHNGNGYCLGSSTEELGVGSEEDYDEPHRTGSLSRMRYRFEDSKYHHQPNPSTPQRQKNKFEALDCLVISTIHSLSNKVRTSSRNLLEKIQLQSIDDENGALVEEMISQLKELEVTASPQKGPSRELSGTLKNMKKLEQVILVLDRILCSESDDL